MLRLCTPPECPRPRRLSLWQAPNFTTCQQEAVRTRYLGEGVTIHTFRATYDVMGAIWLRYTADARRRTASRLLFLLVLLPVSVALAVWDDRAAFWPVMVFTVVVVFLSTLAALYRMLPKYYIQQDNLMRRGRREPVCSLPEANADVRVRPYRGAAQLVLWIDGTEIRLGDSSIVSYYRPAALKALANGLGKSDYVQPQEAADWLRDYATHPTRDKWPELVPGS